MIAYLNLPEFSEKFIGRVGVMVLMAANNMNYTTLKKINRGTA